MSEHTHTHAPVEHVNPLTVPITVERNGINKTLSVFKWQRGPKDGNPYQAPQIETDGTDSLPSEDATFLANITFLGKQNVTNFQNVILKRIGQDYMEDSVGEDGIFNLDRFTNYWKDLRSSAMKLSELNESYQQKVAEYQDATTKLIAAFDAGDTNEILALKAKVNALGISVKALKAEYEERKARRSKEAAAETVAPE